MPLTDPMLGGRAENNVDWMNSSVVTEEEVANMTASEQEEVEEWDRLNDPGGLCPVKACL